MRRMKIWFILATALLLITPAAVFSAYTPVSGTGLTDILDGEYGAGNYERVDDSIDIVWRTVGSDLNVTFLGQLLAQGGYTNYLDLWESNMTVIGNNLVFDFISSDDGVYNSNTFTTTYHGDLILKDRVYNGGTLLYELSSVTSANSDGTDHMVTYKLTGTGLSGYVIGWEDQLDGDWDYDDFVVKLEGMEPSPVPVPATLILFASGVAGLVGIRRKKVL